MPDEPHERTSEPADAAWEPSATTLGAWRADAAIEERRSRWLARGRLDDELDLAATLLSRAEAGHPVALDLLGGRRHVGHLWWVGPAAVGLRAAGGADLLVASAAIACVRDVPGRALPTLAERGVPTPRPVPAFGSGTLTEALAALAEDRPTVAVHGRDGTVLAGGSLGAVGGDVFTVNETGGASTLVVARAVAWVLLDP